MVTSMDSLNKPQEQQNERQVSHLRLIIHFFLIGALLGLENNVFSINHFANSRL